MKMNSQDPTRIPNVHFFGRETAGKPRETGQKQRNILLRKLGEVNFLIRNTGL